MRFASAALSFVLWSAQRQQHASQAFANVASMSHGRRRFAVATTAAAMTRYGNNNNNNHNRRTTATAVAASSSAACRAAAAGGGGRFSALSTTGSTITTTALNSAVSADTETETETPVEIFRKDYEPLPYTVSRMNMDFQIYDGRTVVESEMKLAANPAAAGVNGAGGELELNGDETCVKLLYLSMDGRALVEGTDYALKPGKLILKSPADGAVVKTVVEIVPEDNTKLAGLYKSGAMYCTQCEAHGFQRITYYPDRPDNMAVFDRVRIEADREACPVLLSNGNMVEMGDVDGSSTRHYAVWSDPFPKPSYLFATVAGNLGLMQDTYETASGRTVQLHMFSEHENVDKLEYAMGALKRAMRWDEERFGLEYDLNLYNVVAVESFNMGAMENKGLNVFNTAYVLADQATATDVDFENVEGVIGHEYFHNWTGNRVTCRDWFQLTLKEGLTVFRDQEFSGDLNSKPVKRIEDVKRLRGSQFSEDASPLAHPIRPESYISMDNFYTSTVYVKGAEVIRMYQTLLTVEGFRKGMDLYFERHDGSAVTCDDFLAAMADANGVDLSQFARWYETPGTPVVKYAHEQKDGTFTLTLTQSTSSGEPLHIPVSIGLLDKETGEEVVPTTVLDLKETKQTFTFDGLKGEVVPSILRGFSAPVKLVTESGDVDEEALAFLAARDTDGFNRWESGQVLYTKLVFETMDGSSDSTGTLDFVNEAFGRTLRDRETTDYSIQAYALTLPSEATLAEEMEIIEPIAIYEARGSVKKGLARTFYSDILARYNELTEAMEAEGGEFKVDATAIGRRRLRNVLLDYLCSVKETDQEQVAAAELATNHFNKATGMSDKMAALSALASMDGKGAVAMRDDALATFYKDAAGDALVLDKWFRVQALADLPDILERALELTRHPDFTMVNPNRCRSVLGAFSANPAAFHANDGSGYAFIGEKLVELDKLNPQVSSRMGRSLITWRRYSPERGALMKAELEKLSALELSNDLYEIVTNGLK